MGISMEKTLLNNDFFKADRQPPKGFASCKFTIYQRGMIKISMDSISRTFAIHLSELPNPGICWLENKNNLLKVIIDSV